MEATSLYFVVGRRIFRCLLGVYTDPLFYTYNRSRKCVHDICIRKCFSVTFFIVEHCFIFKKMKIYLSQMVMFTVYIITIDTETIDKISNAMHTTKSLTLISDTSTFLELEHK